MMAIKNTETGKTAYNYDEFIKMVGDDLTEFDVRSAIGDEYRVKIGHIEYDAGDIILYYDKINDYRRDAAEYLLEECEGYNGFNINSTHKRFHVADNTYEVIADMDKISCAEAQKVLKVMEVEELTPDEMMTFLRALVKQCQSKAEMEKCQ
jgi:hypothetical protein